jgi:hypothetical protein
MFSLLPVAGKLACVIRLTRAALQCVQLCSGVSRFEAFCAANRVELDFDAISEIYSDPSDLRPITDPYLRMQARAIITQVRWLTGRQM